MKQTILYTFSLPNSRVEHTLFGTIHTGWPEMYTDPIMVEALNRLNKSGVFVSESDLMDNGMQMQNHIYIKDGAKLTDYLSLKKYLKLEKFAAKIGVKLNDWMRLKPLFLQNQLVTNTLNPEQNPVCDLYLLKLAIALGLDTDVLETTERQIQILEQIPIEWQLSAVQKAVLNLPNFTRNTKKMLQKYRVGDGAYLHKKVSKSLGSLRQIMLIERNVLMTDRIVALLESYNGRPIFFCCGAGHLLGNNGMVKLLKHRGYSIKALKIK